MWGRCKMFTFCSLLIWPLSSSGQRRQTAPGNVTTGEGVLNKPLRPSKALTIRAVPGDATLSAPEMRRLYAACFQLVELCSMATGKIDPAVAEIMTGAQDRVMARLAAGPEARF